MGLEHEGKSAVRAPGPWLGELSLQLCQASSRSSGMPANPGSPAPPPAPCSIVPPDRGDRLPKWGPAAQAAHRASAAPPSRDGHELLKLGRRLGQQHGPALAQGCVFCGWHCPGGAAGGALPVHIQPGLKSASPCWRERRACPKRRLLGLPVPPDGCK